MNLLRFGIIPLSFFLVSSLAAMKVRWKERNSFDNTNNADENHQDETVQVGSENQEDTSSVSNRFSSRDGRDTDQNGRLKDMYLHKALYDRNAPLIKSLISKGADINAQTRLGYTPLHIAACTGQLDICKLLVKKGATIDAATTHKYGGTPLYHAAETGHAEVCEFLVDNGADINVVNKGLTRYVPLHIAAKNGHVAVCELLIDKGASIEAKAFGMTSLCFAAQYGHEAVCKLLIAKGADMSVFHYFGESLQNLTRKTLVDDARNNYHYELANYLELMISLSQADWDTVEQLVSEKEYSKEDLDMVLKAVVKAEKYNLAYTIASIQNKRSTTELEDLLNERKWDEVGKLVQEKGFSEDVLKKALQVVSKAECYEVVSIIARILKGKLNSAEPAAKKVKRKKS